MDEWIIFIFLGRIKTKLKTKQTVFAKQSSNLGMNMERNIFLYSHQGKSKSDCILFSFFPTELLVSSNRSLNLLLLENWFVA